jgi:pseudouridine-5'-phosphate glycosidase
MQRRRELSFWGPFAFLLICFILFRISFDAGNSGEESRAAANELFVFTALEEDGVSYRTKMKSLVKIAPSVAQAIRQGKPVVALESTVVTHGGLGYPRNLQTAKALENEIRQGGAIPATIAIMDGAIRIGLSDTEMETLARTDKAVKCSKRDLGAAVALKWTGSTTVAATMFAAHLAGIEIFATGGLGGVHRGAFGGSKPSLDVSADLTEFGQTPVTVVCAGVKSILDVRGTLEWLETQGVPVGVLGSNSFPQFFSAATDENTRIPSPLTLDTVEDVAKVMFANKYLGLKKGMVLAVPNANPVKGIEAIVEQALQESQDAVKGKDITPYVLKRVAELTEGKSIVSNIELLKNNARIAAQVAVEYSKLSLNGFDH